MDAFQIKFRVISYRDRAEKLRGKAWLMPAARGRIAMRVADRWEEKARELEARLRPQEAG